MDTFDVPIPAYAPPSCSIVWGLLRELQNDERAVDLGLSLTANENILSKVRASVLATPLESRYHLGPDAGPGGLAANGVLALERVGAEVACERLGAAGVDFRPLSGVHAMMSTLLALTDPGDDVYSIPPAHGGHFATSEILRRAGRTSRFLPWDAARFDIDLAALAEDVRTWGAPRLIFLDPGMTLFPLALRELRAALGPEPRIVYDGSHTLGLLFGGEFQAPLAEGCDVVQGNTHKSFPGPQKAMVAFRDIEGAAKFSRAMDGGLVSSQHTHHTVALLLAVLEMREYGRAYAGQLLRNATAFAAALERSGFRLVQRDGIPTRSHVIAVEETGDVPVREACARLMQVGVSTNARPFAGRTVLRLGVQELTRRGMKETEMEAVAHWMGGLLLDGVDPARVRSAVRELRGSFSQVDFAFDRLASLLHPVAH
jgi:glycine/serine hydroxymethyltransferase